MNKVKTGNKVYQYAENWAEVDRKKAIELAHLLSNTQLNETEKKLAALQKLLPLKKVLPKQLKEQYDFDMLGDLLALDPTAQLAGLNDYNIALHQLTETVAFALSPEGFHQDKLEFFQHQKKWYYGPGNYFKYVSFDEFLHCDIFAHEYSNTGNEQALDCLVATLYRVSRPTKKKKEILPGLEIKKDGTDRRENFDVDKINWAAQQLATLPKKYKLLALYYFLGCKHALLEEDKNSSYPAFAHHKNEEEEETEAEGSQPTEETDDLAKYWENIAWNIARHEEFGSIEAVEQMKIRKLISFLQNQKMHLEELKSQKQDGSTI